MEMTIRNGFAALTLPLLFGCATMSGEALEADDAYDLVIRGGTIYDGSGGAPYIGDVAVEGDRIVAVGIFRARRTGSSMHRARPSPPASSTC